jgi:malonyl-CoA/methylmalonyl-CoA synthetase
VSPGKRFITDLIRRVDDTSRASKVAIINANNQPITYGVLSSQSALIAATLEKKTLSRSGNSIGCYIGSQSDYVSAMLATWRLGKRFVPLSITHPEQELRYFVEDSSICAIIYSANGAFAPIQRLGVPLIDTRDILKTTSTVPGTFSNLRYSSFTPGMADEVNADALVLYTSGTTGRPKGAVHTREGLQALVISLVNAWDYNERDKILHFLPLHHLHGKQDGEQ